MQYVKMLLPFFQLSLAIRNVWPERMSLKAFIMLYLLLLLSAIPVTILSCVPYGLFGILVAICLFGLFTYCDTAAQNIGMGMIGFVLACITASLLEIIIEVVIPPDLLENSYVSFGVELIYISLFYMITALCGKVLRKVLLSGRGVLRFPQIWYLIDAAVLLLITIYLFDNLIPGQNGSVGKMIYNNVLHLSGYLLVLLFLFLAMRRFYLEKIQTETKQKAWQDLQD